MKNINEINLIQTKINYIPTSVLNFLMFYEFFCSIPSKMYLQFILFCIFCILSWYSLPFVWKLIKLWIDWRRIDHRLMDKIPGPAVKFPVIGNLDLLWHQKSANEQNLFFDLTTKLAEEYRESGLFKLRLGTVYIVTIYRFDTVRDMLKDRANIEKPFVYKFFKQWLGKGLPLNDNPSLWKERRILLTPAFHNEMLKKYLVVMNEQAGILVGRLAQLEKQDHFDICPYIFSCTLDIISETTTGYQTKCQLGNNMDYIEAVKRLIECFITRLIRPWLWLDPIFNRTKAGKQMKKDLKTVHQLSRRLINEKKQQILENNENNSEMSDKRRKRLTFLELLLDLHLKDNSLSLEDIREELDSILFAGYDTVAATLSWTLFLIGLYPEVRHKIQEELDSIVSQDEDITIDDMRRMPYLDSVIKESQRLYTPVSSIMREITEDVKLGDYKIPKGVIVNILISSLHSDPNQFPEPYEFRPERFLKENQSESDNPFRFKPFSGGPRDCIGQKFAMNDIKVILSKVLTNFEIKSLEEMSEVKAIHSSVTLPENGIKVSLTKRKK